MEFIRDLVIVISGSVFTIVVIVVAVVALLVYMKIRGILKSADTITTKIKNVVAVATDEIAVPMIKAAGIINIITSGILAVGKIFKKGE